MTQFGKGCLIGHALAVYVCGLVFLVTIVRSERHDAVKQDATANHQPASAFVDPTATMMDDHSFAIHVFFSDRSGSLYCSGGRNWSGKEWADPWVACTLTNEAKPVEVVR